MTDTDDTDEGTEADTASASDTETTGEEGADTTETSDTTKTSDTTETSDTEPLADLADEVGIAAGDDGNDPLGDLTDDLRPADHSLDATSDTTTQSDETSGGDTTVQRDETTTDASTGRPDGVTDVETDTPTDDGGETVVPDEPASHDDAPLSELAEEVAATESLDKSPFEEMDTSGFDTTDAWQRLEEDEQFEQPGSGADAEPVAEPSTAAPEHVVDKRQYCQQCPYLSAPPDVTCGREGTEIVEVTDADHFRVRACPMIGDDGPNFDAVDEE